MAYVTVEDIRNEGVSDPPHSKELIDQRIALAQTFIEEVTRRFFERRDGITVSATGDGTKKLKLPVPPISASTITSVTVDSVILDAADYTLVMPSFPDGRYNPILEKVGGVWKNDQAVAIIGDFGFVDIGDKTPLIIQDCCKRLVVHDLPLIGDEEGQRARHIQKEKLADYEYELSSKASSGGLFGDPRIDDVLGRFRRRSFRLIG